MLMKNSITDTTDFKGNSVILFISGLFFYHGKVQRRVKMFCYSPIHTNSFLSSMLQEYWYSEFKETNPYNLQILLSY